MKSGSAYFNKKLFAIFGLYCNICYFPSEEDSYLHNYEECSAHTVLIISNDIIILPDSSDTHTLTATSYKQEQVHNVHTHPPTASRCLKDSTICTHVFTLMLAAFSSLSEKK